MQINFNQDIIMDYIINSVNFVTIKNQSIKSSTNVWF